MVKVMGMSLRRILYWVTLLSFLSYIPINLFLLNIGLVDLRLQDFGAYYNAADRFISGESIYKTTSEIPTLQATISEDMPYLYPPIFVIIFVPFLLFPPLVSGIIWDLVVLSFLIWAISRLVATFDVGLSARQRLILYVCVVSFGPTITWIKAGQVSGLLAGFLCLSGATLREGDDRLSGVFTAFGGVVKPFYAPSGAHLLSNRTRLVSALFSAGMLLFLGILIVGFDAHIEYVSVLMEGKGWGVTIEPRNWHASHFNPFYILGSVSPLARLSLVLLTIIVAIKSKTNEIPIEYIFSLGVLLVPLAGPTTNVLALNTVIPGALMVGLYEYDIQNSIPTIPVIGVLLIHIHPYSIEFLSKFGPEIYPPLESIAFLVPVLQPALYGCLLLVGYTLYRSSTIPNFS